MSTHKPTPIIILGMHRSGTSCLTGTLEQAGVCLGAVSDYNEYNKKGNKENTMIMDLNDKLLKFNDASWHNPPQELSWDEAHESEGVALIQKFENNCNSQFWGFKDPRVLLTLPFWSKLLPLAKYIGTYRLPLKVAKSLNSRANSGIDIDAGLDLWLDYNQRLISFYQEAPFPLISFDLSAKEYIVKLKQICHELDLTYPVKQDFFDRELRHQGDIDNLLPQLPEIETVYKQLLRISIN